MPRVRGSAVANGNADGPSLPAKGKDKGREKASTSLSEEVKDLPVVAEIPKATKPSEEKDKDASEAGQVGDPKQKKTKTTGRETANM